MNHGCPIVEPWFDYQEENRRGISFQGPGNSGPHENRQIKREKLNIADSTECLYTNVRSLTSETKLEELQITY